MARLGGLIAALAMVPAACSGDSAAEIGGAVPCLDALDGDVCDTPSEACGDLLEGGGCSKVCREGTWRVSCPDDAGCDPEPVVQGSACNVSAVPSGGCRYEVTTACGGPSEVRADCAPSFGWYYALSCDPDCTSLDEATCDENLGCAWAVPCDDDPALAPRCIDFPPRVGSTCDDTCSTCVVMSVSHDLSSGDCTSNRALIGVCEDP